jgi:hypothetical protein
MKKLHKRRAIINEILKYHYPSHELSKTVICVYIDHYIVSELKHHENLPFEVHIYIKCVTDLSSFGPIALL